MPSLPEPTFLADRSLGRYVVPTALRDAGLDVLTLVDVWGEDRAHELADTTWLAHAAKEQYAVLMKDDRIRRNADELSVLANGALRAFVLTNANITGEQMVARFVAHRHRIVQRCRKPGPYVYGVYDSELKRLYP